MSNSAICLICGSPEVQLWGKEQWHTRHDIAGVNAEQVFPGGRYRLMRCRRCDGLSKLPSPSPQELVDLYGLSPSGQYLAEEANESRHFADFETISRMHAPGLRVLDFGCSNGGMLKSWSDNWQKFGLEPSAEASVRAGQNGLTMIDPDEKYYGEPFDVITMVDVIEHLPDGLNVLGKLVDMLSPHGILLIVTGNADYPWWRRVAQAGYWYCDIPEHFCFYSRHTFSHIAKELGMTLQSFQEICHCEGVHDFKGSFSVQLAKNLMFAPVARLISSDALRRLCGRTTYPSFTTARDHVVAVLHKT